MANPGQRGRKLSKGITKAKSKGRKVSPSAKPNESAASSKSVRKVSKKTGKVSSNAVKNSTTTSSSVRTDEYPRISIKMTIAELKEEAVVRGHVIKDLPKKKGDLLYYLVDGSIALKNTPEYSDFAAVRAAMETEKATLASANERSKQERRRAEEERQQRRAKNQAEKDRQYRSRMEARRAEFRAVEIKRQATFHTLSLPSAHACKLAPATNLVLQGSARSTTRRKCDRCFTWIGGWDLFANAKTIANTDAHACDKCDWDICGTCIEYLRMTPAQQRAHDERMAREAAQARRAAEERARLEMKRREEEKARKAAAYDKAQFSDQVMDPPKVALDSRGKRGFTVWKSNGYPPDGFHSYAGPREKEFDSSWPTKKLANSRARYVFFWDNVWGIGPEEMSHEVSGGVKQGLDHFNYVAGDSEEWQVGVVPSAAFDFLGDTKSDSEEDEDEKEDGDDFGYSVCF